MQKFFASKNFRQKFLTKTSKKFLFKKLPQKTSLKIPKTSNLQHQRHKQRQETKVKSAPSSRIPRTNVWVSFVASKLDLFSPFSANQWDFCQVNVTLAKKWAP
jgi:hypothetical protein